jgi:hypothetical protein
MKLEFGRKFKCFREKKRHNEQRECLTFEAGTYVSVPVLGAENLRREYLLQNIRNG